MSVVPTLRKTIYCQIKPTFQQAISRNLATIASTPSTSASTSASSSSSSSSSSTSSSSSWVPPIKPNTEPAYDAALEFLTSHSKKTLEKAADLEKKLSDIKDETQRKEVETKIEKLKISAEINDPVRRWEFGNGKADLSLPVHRHLREQAWRKGGSLDKLTERITLQHVIPDLIPSITPTVDLQIFLGEGNGIGDHSTENCQGEVLAGVKVEPFKFFENGPPKVIATPFHREERKYTLIMIDLDVPDVENEGFGTFCHWLINDLSLSSTKTSPSASELSSPTLPFIPVHPTEGSGLHRYAFLLLSQPQDPKFNNSKESSTSSFIQRENFDVRSYVEQHGLEPEGIHFFRSAWRKEDQRSRTLISTVWRDIRGLTEPKYGKAPKVDRLKDVFGEKESRYY